MDMDDWIQAELDCLHKAGRQRFLRTVMTAPTGRVVLDGREVIVLGSNNYLGLSTHPKVIEAAVAAVQEYGTGASGSRLLTGNCQLYTNLESKIAESKGTEAALAFSSGYLANIGTIPAVAGDGDLILSDALNHASIIDGCRLSKANTQVYQHRDIDHLESLLTQSANFGRKLIVTDGVFSMDGNIAPLPDICGLADRYNAVVIVDEAHSFGVLGQSGGGAVEHFGLENRAVIQTGTLSKAIGGLGGYVAGSRKLIELLINRARSFIFSTGLPPATLAAASAAIDAMRSTPKLRGRLFANSRQIATALSETGFQCLSTETQILPLILGSAEVTSLFAEMLLDHGVYAPAVRPPTVPEGTGRLRISAMATHTPEDIEGAIGAFNAVKDSCQWPAASKSNNTSGH